MSTKEEVKQKIPKLEGTPKRIVCYGCSLLCDDVFVELDSNGKIIRTVNSCFRGNEAIRTVDNQRRITQPTKKQMGLTMTVGMDEGINVLRENITSADNITFYGLGSISYQEQISVLKFIKKMMDKNKSVKLGDCSNFLGITAELGLPLTTVGQAINNGDVFMFWKTDPTHSHPKLTGKILFSRGYFRSTGKEVKKLVLIEDKESDLTNLKDVIFNDSGVSSKDFVSYFEKLINAESVEGLNFPGIDKVDLKELKSYTEATEYGVLVTTVPFIKKQAHEHLSQVKRLLDALNESTKGRFMLLPLTLTSNEIGLSNAVLSLFTTDEIKKLLTGDEDTADLAVIFGGKYLHDEYQTDEFSYDEKTRILFDNLPSDVSKRANITIPYKLPGIELSDMAVRLDQIGVELEKFMESSDEIWSLTKIFGEI